MALVGREAPDFELEGVVDGGFKEVKLSDFRGRYVVIVFYPLDFTFVCPTELIAFAERYEEFKERGAEVLAISVDSKYTHLAWQQTSRKQGGVGKLPFPHLSDINKKVACAYDVLSEEGVALRGLFIIDDEGIVQHATINNLAVGRSVDETLRLLDAIRTIKQTGEACPADWRPGEETLKPDVEAARGYFEKHYAE